MVLFALVGMGFALYLSHVEKDILEVWCLYCVISQGIIALILLLSVGWFAWIEMRKRREQRTA